MKNYNRKEVTTDYTKYYLDNKYHRLDGPAVEWANGSKEWWINGKLHRENGPAVEFANGRKVWYMNGQCHRIDGPAIEWVDGSKYWCINGVEHTEKEFNVYINNLKIPEYFSK